MVALLLSLLAFWKNYLSPFKVEFTHGSQALTLYKITPEISGNLERKTWWIPSFDMSFSFHNTGQKAGLISDIRIIGKMKTHSIDKQFFFYPQFIVDFKSFDKDRTKRMTWLKTSVISGWLPILLPPKSTHQIHVILERGRWDHKEVGVLKFYLEIFTSAKNKWIKCCDNELPIDDSFYNRVAAHSALNPHITDPRRG